MFKYLCAGEDVKSMVAPGAALHVIHLGRVSNGNDYMAPAATTVEDTMQEENDTPSGVTVQSTPLASGSALRLHLEVGWAPLLLAATPRRYLMCGYLDIDTASRLSDRAGQVSGESMTAQGFLDRLMEDDDG